MNGDDYLWMSAVSVFTLGFGLVAYTNGYNGVMWALFAAFGVWATYTAYAAVHAFAEIGQTVAEQFKTMLSTTQSWSRDWQ